MITLYPSSLENHCVQEIYDYFLSCDQNDTSNPNNEFKKSIDIFIRWHKNLEDKLLYDVGEISQSQTSKALLFTSAIDVEKLYFMQHLVLCSEAADFLPVLIFNYLSNFTINTFKTLSDIKNGKKKDQNRSKIIIHDQLFKTKITDYLKPPVHQNSSMNDYYNARTQKHIKFSFIHIACFLKILSLPICNDSDKLSCMAWYFTEFPDNANSFFSEGEKNSLRIDDIIYSDGDDLELFDNDEKYIYAINSLNQYINYIENPECLVPIDKKVAQKIEEFILCPKPYFHLSPCNNSFLSKYNYFCGKYLDKLMINNNRGFDFVKLFDYFVSADEVVIGDDDELSNPLTIYNAKFLFSDIQYMKKANDLSREDYYPLHTMVFHQCFSYHFEGCISSIECELNVSSNMIKCFIPQLINPDGNPLSINNLHLKVINCSKLKSRQWALYILYYYIMSKGFSEKRLFPFNSMFSDIPDYKERYDPSEWEEDLS